MDGCMLRVYVANFKEALPLRQWRSLDLTVRWDNDIILRMASHVFQAWPALIGWRPIAPIFEDDRVYLA